MSEQADIVRAYIVGLTEHRPSDVEEAVALTALEQLRRERACGICLEHRHACQQVFAALERIAAPKRPDGTYNFSREACEQIAKEALRRADT